MRWSTPENGQAMRNFLDTFCKDFPEVATGMMNREFGDFGLWFDKDFTHNPTCGCLIGTAALCMTESEDIREKVIWALRSRSFYWLVDTTDAAMIFVLAWRAKNGEDLSVCTRENVKTDPLYRRLSDIGFLVNDEKFAFALRNSADRPFIPPTRRQQQLSRWFKKRLEQNLSKKTNTTIEVKES